MIFDYDLSFEGMKSTCILTSNIIRKFHILFDGQDYDLDISFKMNQDFFFRTHLVTADFNEPTFLVPQDSTLSFFQYKPFYLRFLWQLSEPYL